MKKKKSIKWASYQEYFTQIYYHLYLKEQYTTTQSSQEFHRLKTIVMRTEQATLRQSLQTQKIPAERWCKNPVKIISPNVNGLNAPIQRHRLAGWIRKLNQTLGCLQETHLNTQIKHGFKSKVLEDNSSSKQSLQNDMQKVCSTVSICLVSKVPLLDQFLEGKEVKKYLLATIFQPHRFFWPGWGHFTAQSAAVMRLLLDQLRKAALSFQLHLLTWGSSMQTQSMY